MNASSNKYKRYLMTANVNNVSRYDLQLLSQQLQHEISHNYMLIKSLHTRVKDLEFEVERLKALHKTNNIRLPSNVPKI